MLKAVADSLQEYPELNARLERDEIVYLDRYDIGVAVQTEQGLVVPVVRSCDARSVDELAADVARLADEARAGKLAPEDLRGGTFTVTSAGKLAGLFQTPIVNYPEVAILSIGRIADRPVVRDGAVVVRKTGTIAVTFDHRVIDGARASEFGLAVIQRLERGLSRDLLGEVRLDHLLDLGRAHASLEPADDALLLDQQQRRHDFDLHLCGRLWPLLDVDSLHVEPAALLARKVSEQALHAARRP